MNLYEPVEVTAPVLRTLFRELEWAAYGWDPQTPDRLVSLRESANELRALFRVFGLGLGASAADLHADGLSEQLLSQLVESQFLFFDPSSRHDKSLFSKMAVSGGIALSENTKNYIIHDHWPPDPKQAESYVHFGPESLLLLREIRKSLCSMAKKSGQHLLDLGCGSGALSFQLGDLVESVCGIDSSQRAISWARATASANENHRKTMRFEVGTIPSKTLPAFFKEFDFIISNPPMVLGDLNSKLPHRDGGKLGIELPLEFIGFAKTALSKSGRVFMLATNPICGGRGIFFEELKKLKPKILDQKCLEKNFNQNVAKKRGYHEQGVERIELWFLSFTF